MVVGVGGPGVRVFIRRGGCCLCSIGVGTIIAVPCRLCRFFSL